MNSPEEEMRQIIEALRGHARWLRNYKADPRRYHEPTTSDELDRIADRLAALRQEGRS